MTTTLIPQQAPTVRDAEWILRVCEQALAVRSSYGWSQWLLGDIQAILPHELLIAAWGDFQRGTIAYDVVTRSPALSAQCLDRDVIQIALAEHFRRWSDGGQQPVLVDVNTLWPGLHRPTSSPPCVLVHGVADQRTHQDFLYLFAGSEALCSPHSRRVCEVMLPFIDMGFRQVTDRGQSAATQAPFARNGWGVSSFADGLATRPSQEKGCVTRQYRASTWAPAETQEGGTVLSAREAEIMEWVRMGKTNSEIAMILTLSTFTVKNHMRRIYKKLDVLNRAQAVGSLGPSRAMPRSASR
ncbi:MAG: transcriptional regulator, LuxR family [Ramlibacter sp.]|jgi:transcriptional regulator EpsA|nr:transcriptional regulator, LuxR family [Ramlibacter sp.]MDB5912878.1 transcriptional regulator, LuxR family [Ramlibacter sp.]